MNELFDSLEAEENTTFLIVLVVFKLHKLISFTCVNYPKGINFCSQFVHEK